MQFFCMMTGLPGSGKSWYAENELPNTVIHSSDAIRDELLGDVSDQNHQELVFQCRVLQVLAEDTGTPAVVRSKGEWYPYEDGE